MKTSRSLLYNTFKRLTFFPVNIAKFLSTPILKINDERLSLYLFSFGKKTGAYLSFCWIEICEDSAFPPIGDTLPLTLLSAHIYSRQLSLYFFRMEEFFEKAFE